MLQRTCKHGRYRSPFLLYCKADLHVTRGLRSVKRYIKFWRHDTSWRDTSHCCTWSSHFLSRPSLPPHSNYRHTFSNISHRTAHYFWNLKSPIVLLWLNYTLNMGAMYSIETLVIALIIFTLRLIYKQWSHFTTTCCNNGVAAESPNSRSPSQINPWLRCIAAVHWRSTEQRLLLPQVCLINPVHTVAINIFYLF